MDSKLLGQVVSMYPVDHEHSRFDHGVRAVLRRTSLDENALWLRVDAVPPSIS